MSQKILIYDLETNSPDSATAEPKLMGFRTSFKDEFQWTDNISIMQSLLDVHDVIIGYNIVNFDNEIMQRYGVSFKGKVIIDLFQILHGKGFGSDKGRKGIITTPSGAHLADVLHNKSLDAAVEALDGPRKVGDVDYNWFKSNFSELDEDIQKRALEYLKGDIEATYFLYKYIEDFFADFRDGGLEIDGEWKQFLDDEQRRRKYYLTSSTGSLAYKIICNLAGIDERYGDEPAQDYGGGFVALPDMDTCEGDIYCLDYNSLYPHIMMQANLYGRTTTESIYKDEVWEGKGISYTEGKYNAKELAPVGKVLQQMFLKRNEYKKQKDERQYTIKIIINTIYGLLGNPAFASVCDFVAASDCTRLGRQWVNAARLHFAEHGYNVLYTDTDSVYLEDPFKNKKRLIEIKDKHVADIKASVPFPQDTFDMGVDDEIEFIAFFKNQSGYLKKNYLYVTKDKKLKIKGLPIVRSDATPVTKLIFNKYIKPSIIEKHVHRFQRKQIATWIEEELRADISVAARFFKVKEPELYKLKTQMQYQIATHELYGPGEHYLLKLDSRIQHPKGCGSNNNYVGTQYADEVRITQLDLSKTWRELDHFIEPEQKTLEGFI